MASALDAITSKVNWVLCIENAVGLFGRFCFELIGEGMLSDEVFDSHCPD